MLLKDLIQKRQSITCDIIQCIQDQVTGIKVSAEHMIECATNIKGQGYSTFMSSREEFLSKIEGLSEQLRDSAIINTCTHH